MKASQGLLNNLFRLDSDGRIIFFPHSPKRKGFILTDETKIKIEHILDIFYWGQIPIMFAIFFSLLLYSKSYWLAFLSMGIWGMFVAGWYYYAIGRITRNLEISVDRSTSLLNLDTSTFKKQSKRVIIGMISYFVVGIFTAFIFGSSIYWFNVVGYLILPIYTLVILSKMIRMVL